MPQLESRGMRHMLRIPSIQLMCLSAACVLLTWTYLDPLLQPELLKVTQHFPATVFVVSHTVINSMFVHTMYILCDQI